MTLPPAFLARPIAHRAYHDIAARRPENSRAAVRAAVAAGYGIEIDVQPSADGVPMVFHDYDLGRLTGVSGPIARRRAAELAELSLLQGDEPVPTLAEVLSDVAGRVPLLIEVKDQDGAMGPDVGPLERAVAKALADYAGPVAVMSFNPHSVAVMAEAAPGVPRGLTTESYDPKANPTLPRAVCNHLRAIPDFGRVGASFISHEAADLASPHVAALKAKGVPILCWTIRSPEAEAEARKIADNVTFEGYPA
ncbi:glycerophosphodiester phosphodiesterase family protein [Flavimaricola marinus]|uniref:Cytoplasmic glycerophosphodiester phosphodiesterase n=1 Tax=Flavimaricola marinus TaxID=1819565 RepID=A0A238LFP5_9RHOB|nr:glycerophosphodiester phosphodiesterase family protein [Flavimaricola marinus]SMY08403.1 cytoplasmic glycerophosphodiester phosphodiesterase [Flavimaricola marinus]